MPCLKRLEAKESNFLLFLMQYCMCLYPMNNCARTRIVHYVYTQCMYDIRINRSTVKPDLPTCTDFRGTYRFWPSITISRFHAVVYRFWKMREFLGLADFVLFCFRRYSVILSASCTYRQSRRCVAAINSPPGAMSQC